MARDRNLMIGDGSASSPARHGRRSNKPPAVKAAVINRAAAGFSKTRIARELGLSRPTVNVILNETEIAEVIQQGKSDAVRMVPKAINVFNHALENNNARVATSVLTGVGVLKSEANGGSARVTLNIVMDARPRPVEIPTIPRRDEILTLATTVASTELDQGGEKPKKSSEQAIPRNFCGAGERRTEPSELPTSTPRRCACR